MDPNILSAIIGAAALIAGIILGKFLFAKNTRRQVEEAELQSQTILKEAELRAETIRKEKELEAKEKFVKMRSAHEKEVNERSRKINDTESRIRQKEQTINQKEGNLDKQIKDNEVIKDNLNRQIELVNIKRTELEKHQEEHIRRLEKIAGLSADEAKSQLVESLKQEAQTQAIGIQQEIIDEANRKPIKKPGKLSFKPYSELLLNRPLKTLLLFLTWKATK